MGRGDNYYAKKRRGVNMFVFLAYLVLGVYFINFPFNFFKVPEIITQFDKWIIFIAEFLGNLPGASIKFTNTNIWFVIAYYVLLVGIFSASKLKVKKENSERVCK